MSLYVYPKCNSDKIWRIAWVNLVTGFYAMSTPNWCFSFVPFSVFITSLLHWHNPIKDSRRQKFDILVVKSTVIYQMFRAYGAANMWSYYFSCSLGLLSYYQGVVYYNQDSLDISCNYHMCVHVFALCSNIILYSGKIPSLADQITNIHNLQKIFI